MIRHLSSGFHFRQNLFINSQHQVGDENLQLPKIYKGAVKPIRLFNSSAFNKLHQKAK